MADILEGFGCVLAGYVEKNFFSTTGVALVSLPGYIPYSGPIGKDVRVLIDEAGAVVDLVVDDQIQVLLGVVLGDLLESEFFGGHFD